MPKEIDDKRIVQDEEDIGRTADGEPRVERGTAESAISRPSKASEQAEDEGT